MSEDKTSDGKFPVGADAPSVLTEVTERQTREKARREAKRTRNKSRRKWQKEGVFPIGEVTASERKNRLKHRGGIPPADLPPVNIIGRMPRPER